MLGFRVLGAQIIRMFTRFHSKFLSQAKKLYHLFNITTWKRNLDQERSQPISTQSYLLQSLQAFVQKISFPILNGFFNNIHAWPSYIVSLVFLYQEVDASSMPKL